MDDTRKEKSKMLKIIKASEPIKIEQIITVLYGQPGIGKSTLAFTSESPLLLDFDKGAYRATNRKDIVSIGSWGEVTQMSGDDLAPYKTVIVDTAGRALDFITATLLKENHKWNFNGALTLQGYGVLKSRFAAWLNNLTTMGKDVVLLAHSSEEKKGDEIIERLDVQGGSKAEIYKQADAMGRLYIEDKKRMLSFSPTDTAFGKNPANLDVMQVPRCFRKFSFFS
ncbi:MAG: ATP-binding protein [Nanoarchaeota archaeon]